MTFAIASSYDALSHQKTKPETPLTLLPSVVRNTQANC
jgi:hypothetical protein